jgi:hypothetical protein
MNTSYELQGYKIQEKSYKLRDLRDKTAALPADDNTALGL